MSTEFKTTLDPLQIAHFDSWLAKRGMTQARPCIWVGASEDQIRPVFHLASLKGRTFSARWGFAVDFVPEVHGKRLAWKRSLRRVNFDLVIDPIDEAGDVPNWCSLSMFDHEDRSPAVAVASLKAAFDDFGCICDRRALVRLFEQRSTMAFRRFGLKNYVQSDLAWGLLSESIGDEATASFLIGRFCSRFAIDDVDPVLIKARREAELLGRNMGIGS